MIKKFLPVLVLVLAAIVVTGLVLTACGASSTGSSNTTNNSATSGFDGGTITIGAVNSTTGPGAMGGAEQKWAYDQAVKDQNAAGGIVMNGKHYKVVLKYADDQSDPSQAAAAMEQLIKVDGLHIILSTQVTPINMAAATVAEKYKALYMMNISWADWIQKANYKYGTDMFFTPAIAAGVPFEMIKEMPKSEWPKKWGMFTENNSDGQGLAQGVAAGAKAMGLDYVMTQAITPGGNDYSSEILKLKNAGVDGLLAFNSPADAVTFLKQMKEANYSPKFFFGWKGYWPSQLPTALGADANYVGHDGFWSEDLGYPGDTQLGQEYAASHNGDSSVSIGLSYAVAQVLFQAIANANSTDPAAVHAAIAGHTFTGTTMGDVTYNSHAICTIPGVGNEWLSQQRKLIVPKKPASVQPQWFVPWNQR